MRTIHLVTLGVLLLLLVSCNNCQHNPYPTSSLHNQLEEDYTRLGVNMHSYEFFDIEDTPAPTGYEPFYISHYGRHGSRSNWGDGDYNHIIAVLDSAKKEGVLTAKGDTLLLKTQRVLAAYNSMDGHLTDKGEAEHRRIAERMFSRYSSVFSARQPRITVVGSMVPRCLISMAAFTNRLTQLNPSILYNFDTGEQTQKYIDCCGKVSDDVRQRYHAKEDSIMSQVPYDSIKVMKSLFTALPAVMQGQSIRQLQREIFYTCAIAQDFDIVVNMLDYIDFSTAYYYQIELSEHIALRYCNVEGCGRERVKNAQIALNEIIASADSAIATFQTDKKCPIVANLRFGHDYPLLCIVSLMEIDGPGTPMRAEEIENKWYGHLNICMASNLQLIFYRNRNNDVLVKALYNERERYIVGLNPVDGPYYRWADVKEKWANQ